MRGHREAREKRLSSICNQLEDIEKERGLLTTKIVELDAISSGLQAEFNSIINGKAAVSWLPHETLIAIFEEVVFSQPRISLSSASEVLSHVTRHWRDVALNTPSIWAVIQCRADQRQLELVAMYLKRSKTSLIDLEVTLNQESEDITLFCQMIDPHMDRCRQLSLRAGTQADLSLLLGWVEYMAAPTLRSLDILCEDDRDNPVDIDIFTGGAALLTSVSVTGVGLHGCLPPLQAVTTMKYLDIGRSSWISCAHWQSMLASAMTLIHLDICGEFVSAWGTASPVNLPSLQMLKISHGQTGFGHADHICGILAAILAPSLKVLTLVAIDDQDVPFPEPSSLDFPSLQALILLGMYGGIFQVARAFPNVRHVTCDIYNCDGLRAVLEEIGSDANPRATYWPHLRSLAVTPPHTQNCGFHRLLLNRIDIKIAIERLYITRELHASVEFPNIDIEDLVKIEDYEDWLSDADALCKVCLVHTALSFLLK